jgi:hypothetical protein
MFQVGERGIEEEEEEKEEAFVLILIMWHVGRLLGGDREIGDRRYAPASKQ